jgi:hypothetical protein
VYVDRFCAAYADNATPYRAGRLTRFRGVMLPALDAARTLARRRRMT